MDCVTKKPNFFVDKELRTITVLEVSVVSDQRRCKATQPLVCVFDPNLGTGCLTPTRV